MLSKTNEFYEDDQDMLVDSGGEEVVAESSQIQGRVHEQIRLDRRFTVINRKISELTSFVRVLSEHVSINSSYSGRSTPNSKEGNGINVMTFEASHRSDIQPPF